MDTTYHAQPLWTAAKQTVAASGYKADSVGLLGEPIGGRGTGSTSGSVTQRTRLWQGCPDAEDAERLNGARKRLRKSASGPVPHRLKGLQTAKYAYGMWLSFESE